MDADKHQRANMRIVRCLRLASEVMKEIQSVPSHTLSTPVLLAIKRMEALCEDCIEQIEPPEKKTDDEAERAKMREAREDARWFTLDSVKILWTRRVTLASKTQFVAAARLAIERSSIYRTRVRARKLRGNYE